MDQELLGLLRTIVKGLAETGKINPDVADRFMNQDIQEANQDLTERSIELQEELIEAVDELTGVIDELKDVLKGVVKKL